MIIGFTASLGLDPARAAAADAAAERALRHFPWLTRRTLTAGPTRVEVWGHGSLDDSIHALPDGSLAVRAGWPVGSASWDAVADTLARPDAAERFTLPWEGRVLLLKAGADGAWTLWNDWNGSIPLFHASVGDARVASTLEPVVVAAAGYGPGDFHFAALVSLLLNGHYIGDWTLYREMKIVVADSVAEWADRGFASRRLWSVAPSEIRWDRGWAELADEMYEVMRAAIVGTLRAAPAWTLPLSGGVDSRLIAAFGAEAGIPMRAYTYGPAAWRDTLYAERVARELGLPWKRVDLGTDYLARYSPMWGDWFGGAMHFHGMYQMPFLEAIRDVPEPIVTGFIGDPHGGAQTAGMAPGDRTMLRRFTDKWHMWTVDELRQAMRAGIDGALEEIEAELQRQYDAAPGAHFQKLWMVFEHNHVFGFSYYQPMMYEYWKGVGTPFVDRDLARFTLSLPRTALEDRRLQAEMFKRRLPKMAALPVSFLGMPFKLTKEYLFGRGLAETLPRALRRGPLRLFNPVRNTVDQDAIRAGGRASLWPIYEAWEHLGEWIDTAAVARAHDAAAAGDLQAVNRLEAVQTLALRLLDR
jgi:hypothetical protein